MNRPAAGLRPFGDVYPRGHICMERALEILAPAIHPRFPLLWFLVMAVAGFLAAIAIGSRIEAASS